MISIDVGIIGNSVKSIMFSILGILGYSIPVFFIIIGISLILRKPDIFSNKTIYGLLIAVLTTSLILSVNRIDIVYENGIMVSLKNLIDLNDINHGGIFGLLISIPIFKLIGIVGTYILSFVLYTISIILVFNTSLYDLGKSFKKKYNNIKENKNNEKNNKLVEDKLSEDEIIAKKLKMLEVMNEGETLDEKNNARDISIKSHIADKNKSPFLTINHEVDEGKNKEDQFLNEKEILDKVSEEVYLKNSKEVKDFEKKKSEDIKANNENKLLDKEKTAEEDSKSSPDEYEFPEIALLKRNIKGMLEEEDREEIIKNAKILEDTLSSFGVGAKVNNVSKGPTVTRYELQPDSGVKVSRIVSLSDDIALALAASGVRIEAPIPGKAAVGIEIPNKETSAVYLREVIEDKLFQKSTSKISVALGKDISGNPVVGDLSKMPHMLIAGATGSGKSVCINSIIISILFKYDPEDVKLLMIDPKVVELNIYNGIPHLLVPVVTDPKKAAGALNWAVKEMIRRYESFAEKGVRNIEGFNDLSKRKADIEKLPYIVIIVDELADLMMVSASEVEDYIARLAQMARAAGIHLVIATQRPSVDVITGVIKANIPSRISFAVSSAIDSRTILDSGGAEKLLGKGDMLYYPVGAAKPKRIQGSFISEEEVEAIVKRIKVSKKEISYDNDIIEHIEKENDIMGLDDETDELFEDALRIVFENDEASTSLLQRRLRVGYNRAARIMDDLENRGIISERDGTKARDVLISKHDYYDNKEN
ncbi:MAG: DNA translocase FtsK [Clostridium sp.]|nr:DNA translocase FtsK [Clostridium sp.]